MQQLEFGLKENFKKKFQKRMEISLDNFVKFQELALFLVQMMKK
jgi:hypothetical protein